MFSDARSLARLRMNRDTMLDALQGTTEPWDFVIIGGGATGLGCAVEAASRGYRTLLLEGHDFAKGTSSRSTKLVHGGVRYLKQGNVALVLEALKERLSQGRRVPIPALLAMMLTAFVGTIDEFIQAFLPSRVFDSRDILFNILAGVMAIVASWSLNWARRRRDR